MSDNVVLSIIASMSINRVIGVDNKLPWHIPAELKYFKTITLNKPIIMGRNTYESIGRPLPQRINIVISKNPNYAPHENVITCTSLEKAIEIASEKIGILDKGNKEIFIIGGASLYNQSIESVNKLYLSYIQQEYDGDAFFPEFNLADWKLIDKIEYPEYIATVYIKNNNTSNND